MFEEHYLDEVCTSNKCPNLIVYYYLEAAKNFNQLPYWNGVLKIIKADNGTEDSVIESNHLFLKDLLRILTAKKAP